MKGPLLMCDESGEHPLDPDVFFTEEPASFESKALAFAKGRILDVGCGAGRILRFLQAQGLDAVGFDIDALAVQVCKERGVANVSVGSYYDLERFAPVDTILWLNRTLCTAGSLDHVESLMKSSRLCCSKGGVLIFDSVEIRPDLADPPGIFRSKLHIQYDGQIGEPFSRVVFSSEIAQELLAKTGWSLVDTIRQEDRYMVVCRNA
jgi:SAM-dependent methyltransferase